MSEHTEQCYLVSWAHNQDTPASKIFAIPNGARTAPSTAHKLHMEGMRKGIPDLFLPYACGGYHGLWIEMKCGKGRLSPAQKEVTEELRQDGYFVAVCYGWEDGRDAILEYLDMEG